ncbi:velvet factor-domain-containing protein [Absidia repens]|uniref:Velvet factor-domain-containing protein n=1 Tax=Absidia repens TaxID=90262 RepID=A0A1X2HKB0_9FUNG|nr:velvet factor-domain-containing protein [Absidia repens]
MIKTVSRTHKKVTINKPKRSGYNDKKKRGFIYNGKVQKVDRRPVDPPPIIQLLTDKRDIQYSYFFLYATLVNEADGQDLTFSENTRTTAGTTVQSLHCIKDCGNEGAFFIFADISIRREGLFRLRFTLFEIMGSHSISRCSILSEVFQVYSPKSFPGMSESTFLTRSFSEQGVRIRIRKETRSNLSPPSKRRRSDGDNDDDDDDVGDYGNSATPMSPSSPNSLPPQHIQPLPPVVKSTQSIMSMKNILISPIQEGPAIEQPINSFPLLSSSDNTVSTFPNQTESSLPLGTPDHDSDSQLTMPSLLLNLP